MATWIFPPVAGLIEPAVAPEFYTEDVGAVEILGTNLRVYHCVEQMPLEAAGEPMKVVTVKLVHPINALPRRIMRMAECLACENAPTAVSGWTPRIVR